MTIKNYLQLESAIRMYHRGTSKRRKKEILKMIQVAMKNNGEFRRKVKRKLKKEHQIYCIRFFDIKEQIDIINEILHDMKYKQTSITDTNMALIFASRKAAKEVLREVDDLTKKEIVKQIKEDFKISNMKGKMQQIKLYIRSM